MDDYSLKELQIDMAMLDSDPDTSLELAANIGKILLERNTQLEAALEEYKERVDDQQQEIWNLTRQTKALHEVNDSRIKIYEQLEVNIEELERANHRLLLQNINEQEMVRNLKDCIKVLETRCLELQERIASLSRELDECRAKSMENLHAISGDETPFEAKSPVLEPAERAELKSQIKTLIEQLDDCHAKLGEDQTTIQRLEEQLEKLTAHNNDLEDQIVTEKSALYGDESFCDCKTQEQMSLFDEIEEDDNILEELDSECGSIYGGYQAQSSPKPKAALLRELVEKYEAVLELHKNKVFQEEDGKSVDSGVKSITPELEFASNERSGSASSSGISLVDRSVSCSPSGFSPSGGSSPRCSSPNLIEKTTQTEPDFVYKTDGVEVVIYKNGKPVNLCNKHKCKRLFRDFLAALEEHGEEEGGGFSEKDVSAASGDDVPATVETGLKQEKEVIEVRLKGNKSKKVEARKNKLSSAEMIEETSRVEANKESKSTTEETGNKLKTEKVSGKQKTEEINRKSKSKLKTEESSGKSTTQEINNKIKTEEASSKPKIQAESKTILNKKSKLQTKTVSIEEPEKIKKSEESRNSPLKNNPLEPVLIPYTRNSIEDEFVPLKRKSSKKKSKKFGGNQDKPILVGFSNTAKTLPIDFHYEQKASLRYRKSPASKNLSMLKRMESSYSALLKSTETQNRGGFY